MAEQQKINGQQQRIPEHEADDGVKISRVNQGINDDIRQWFRKKGAGSESSTTVHKPLTTSKIKTIDVSAILEFALDDESSPGLPDLSMVYWGPCLEAPTIISPPEVRAEYI